MYWLDVCTLYVLLIIYLSFQVSWLEPVILSTWEEESWRIVVRGQPEQEVLETPCQPMVRSVGAHLSSLAMWGSANGRIIVSAGLGIKRDAISKITNTKRAGGLAQVLECLTSARLWVQCPSTIRKRRRKIVSQGDKNLNYENHMQ
jgi:hypothetical protein